MDISAWAQLGATAGLFAFAIYQYFQVQKGKKENGNGNGLNAQILAQLERMNDNHLHTIQNTLDTGLLNLTNSLHGDNTTMIGLLGEIKGALNAKK
jgi:hypothetical protein